MSNKVSKLKDRITTESGDDSSTLTLPRIKSRSWKVLVYPESAPENWMKILSETYNWKFIVSPLHDKDVWTEDDEKANPEHKAGEVKKAHYHVLVLFDGETSIYTVWEVLQQINAPIPLKLNGSPTQFERYMIHRGFEDKYQYDESDMKSFGGATINLDSPEDEERVFGEILDFLETSEICSYFRFVCYVRRHNIEWYRYILKHTFPIQALLSSKFQDRKYELQQNLEQIKKIDTTQLAAESLSEQNVVEDVQKE